MDKETKELFDNFFDTYSQLKATASVKKTGDKNIDPKTNNKNLELLLKSFIAIFEILKKTMPEEIYKTKPFFEDTDPDTTIKGLDKIFKLVKPVFTKYMKEYFYKEDIKKYPELLIEIKEKVTFPKHQTAYIHSEISNILQSLFHTQNPIYQGKFFLDALEEETEMAIWESKGIEYRIKLDDLPKLKNKDPKVFVSQIKNISLLMLLAEEQNFNTSVKQASCDFSLMEYAERRGYSKEEIKRGGGFIEELKRDLLTGAYTTYKIDKIKIQGKYYTAHGIPNFYTLYEPEDKTKWKVIFNEPYRTWINEILEGKARQYFIQNRQALEDRKTTEKPYLFLFYMQLSKRRQHNLLTKPVKIINFLKDIGLPDKALRPKECFNYLKECLIYFSKNYQPIPAIESFKIYSDFHKTKEVTKLPLSISEAFKEYSYEDFKDLLSAIGIKDIREAYISFKRPAEEKTKKNNRLDEEEEKLLIKTLKWFNNPYTGNTVTIPIKDQESLIKRYIKKIGKERYNRLFEKEANKPSGANPVIFLTKTLKEYVEDMKYSYPASVTLPGSKQTITYGKRLEKL